MWSVVQTVLREGRRVYMWIIVQGSLETREESMMGRALSRAF